MTTQTISPATRTRTGGAARIGIFALAFAALAVTVVLVARFAPHAIGLDANHLLHGVALLPEPVRNLIGGATLSHLAH